MFKKYFKDRLDIVRAVIIVLLFSMTFRLADLQIVQGDYYRRRSETIRTRNISVTAPRGNILDKYGRVLAGNMHSYSVNLMKADISQKMLNDIALSVLNIIEQNGDTYKDEIPIHINPIRFTFKDDELNWKAKYNIPAEATPQMALVKLRRDYNIPQNVIDVEAYELLKEEYNVEVAFSINDFQYSFYKEELKWKKNHDFDEGTTAEEVFAKLLEKYKIPREQYDDSQAKKILAVKYLLSQKKFRAYEPVEIAVNISDKTRAQIEENRIFLPGVEIIQKPIRKYPNGDFAAHIIGYMGRIGDELERLVAKGYSPQDVIGKSGVENTMEEYLTGKKGTKQIEVDVRGTLINTIDELEPIPGDNVFLTLDSKLQKVAEESLRKTMAQIREGDKSMGFKPFKNASTGAVVALDVNTGKVLAMVSEPAYDPGLFATGISSKDWKSLQPTSKYTYAPKPLYNTAISSTLPPGSTLKMLTGIAGMEEGRIRANDIIVDRGPYDVIRGTSPSCAIWKTDRRTHGAQNMMLAIKNSCNYYFFEVGRRLGGELFEQYALKFGFGQPTGIELLSESRGSVSGPQYKKDVSKRRLESYLNSTLKITDQSQRKEILSFIDLRLSKMQIEKRMKAMGLGDSKAVDFIFKRVEESKWRPGDILNASIGQGDNNATPLQLANYIATIANGGTRYRPYIVEKVVGYDGKVKLQKQPVVESKVDMSPATLEAIKRGMYGTINEGGTATRQFAGSPVVVSGKTGSAQAGQYRPDPKNNPNLVVKYDAHAWFVAFAPYDKPEIAVAVVILQGGSGGYAAPVARAIIEQYLMPEDVKDNILTEKNLVP